MKDIQEKIIRRVLREGEPQLTMTLTQEMTEQQ